MNQDGREYLAGSDKMRRRWECWERDKRHCVECGMFVTLEQFHMDHIAKNHGERRWDNLDNVRTLCPPPPVGNGCHIGAKGAKHA